VTVEFTYVSIHPKYCSTVDGAVIPVRRGATANPVSISHPFKFLSSLHKYAEYRSENFNYIQLATVRLRVCQKPNGTHFLQKDALSRSSSTDGGDGKEKKCNFLSPGHVCRVGTAPFAE
jgi:hypothetical protein